MRAGVTKSSRPLERRRGGNLCPGTICQRGIVAAKVRPDFKGFGRLPVDEAAD